MEHAVDDSSIGESEVHGLCRLCGHEAELQNSHIIPSFVIKHQKETSATGYLRSNQRINRRIQDGPKAYLLCAACEGSFNRWETPFATKIYHPLNRGESDLFGYGDWLLRFSVSVSWRALTWYENMAASDAHRSEDASSIIATALKTWQAFLLGVRENPGAFQQHMMLLDAMKPPVSLTGLPANFNRFLTRGFDINVAHTDGTPAFVFTKMGRVVLLGFLRMKHPQQWSDTTVHVQQGTLGGDMQFHAAFISYLIDRAEKVNEEQKHLSERQVNVIAKTLEGDLDRAAKSETIKAMSRDIEMFGRSAVFDQSTEAARKPRMPNE